MSSNKIRISRSNVSGNRLPNVQDNEGVPYVNLADKQFGVHDTAGQAHDLVGVRFHSSFANYAIGDLVVHDDIIYRCKISHSPLPFDQNYWEDISPLYQVENDCINGTCAVWQRGTVDDRTLSNGYVTIDRFRKSSSLSDSSLDRGTFNVGQQSVPDNPEYNMKYTINSSADPANGYEVLDHRLLDAARRYSGESVVFKFHVEGPAGLKVQPGLYRRIDGSTVDYEVVSNEIIMTGEWQEVVVIFDIPALTFQTPLDQLNFIDFRIWMSSGSNRPSSIGIQTGLFKFSEIEIYKGNRKLNSRRKSEAEELDNCLSYYEAINAGYTTSYIETRPGGVERGELLMFGSKKIRNPDQINTAQVSAFVVGDVISSVNVPCSLEFLNESLNTVYCLLTPSGDLSIYGNVVSLKAMGSVIVEIIAEI